MRILIFIAGSVFYLFNQNNDFLGIGSSVDPDVEIEQSYYSEESDEDIRSFNQSEFEDNNEESSSEYSSDEETFDEGSYIPDDNPVTWDEDPDNFPLETPDTYVNVDGDEVQSPTQYNDIPQGACAICADGTYSFSRNRRGTCSHHGGVAEWLR